MPPKTWIAVSATVASCPANALARTAARWRSAGCGGVGRPQRVQHPAAREFDGLVHVDAQVLDGLKAPDGLVELPSHLGVFDGKVHHRCRCAQRVGRVGDQHVIDEALDVIR